jgi:hypothetical protein
MAAPFKYPYETSRPLFRGGAAPRHEKAAAVARHGHKIRFQFVLLKIDKNCGVDTRFRQRFLDLVNRCHIG